MLATYHWKGVHESYNFVLGSTSIRIHMKKLWSHKVLDTFVPREHGCFRGNLRPFFFRGHGCFSGPTMCQREQGLKLPKWTTMFPWEQMCPKFCVILVFSYEFWLKCFQLQICSSHWHISNDKLQAYIKIKMKWLWGKNSKHIFPWIILAFLGGIHPLSLGNNHVLGENKFKLSWGVI
jgi:hypothetical protein